MSTATLPTDHRRKVPESGAADQLIEERIDEACRALWWAELIRDTLRTLIVAYGGDRLGDRRPVDFFPRCRVSACWLAPVWPVVRLGSSFRGSLPLLGSSIQPEYAARSLERDLPEMKQALTSYVTLRDQRQQPGLRPVGGPVDRHPRCRPAADA